MHPRCWLAVRPYVPKVCRCVLRRRAVTARLAAGFAEASAAGREGVARDLLSGQFPRLAQALEGTLAKLLQDTEVPRAVPHMQAAWPTPCMLLPLACAGHKPPNSRTWA